MSCHGLTLQKFTFLFLTEMFYGAKRWTSLECKLYFLETIVFNNKMEMNFTLINTCLVGLVQCISVFLAFFIKTLSLGL